MELTDDEAEIIRQTFLLTSKPVIYVGNVSEEEIATAEDNEYFKKIVEFAKTENSGAIAITMISGRVGEIVVESTNDEQLLSNIVINLLGRTVLVKNMDAAIKLSKQNKNAFRIVTLDGDIINTRVIPIEDNDTAESLFDKLSILLFWDSLNWERKSKQICSRQTKRVWLYDYRRTF